MSSRSGSPQIWVCDADGSNAVQLTFVEGETVIWQRSWSPGGDRIAYACYADGNQQIYVISSDGGPPARWTSGSSQAAWPKWSRDGRWLYFESGGRIYKMPDGGGEAVDTTVRGAAPVESPDGKTLYFVRGWPGVVSLWSIPVDGGEETKVLDPLELTFVIGRKGIYFARKLDNEGRTEVRHYEFGSGDIRTITTLELSAPSGVTVSPDERTILFDNRDKMGSDIMLVENFR
jgi:Tol biopolymer transport system component